jgi:hypothetical protein
MFHIRRKLSTGHRYSVIKRASKISDVTEKSRLPHEVGGLVLKRSLSTYIPPVAIDLRNGPAKELDRWSNGLRYFTARFQCLWGGDEHLQQPRRYDLDHSVSAVIERGLNANVLRVG